MSGIYIPGMEMPTGTDVLTIAIDSHGKLYSIYVSDGELGINPLHKSVIPVPDHGRLIDKDVMCKECRSVAEEYDGIYPDCTYCPANLAPTIIPEDKEGQ